MRLLAIALFVVLGTGCITNGALTPASVAPGAADATDPLGGFPDPLIVGHAHGDRGAHRLKTPTMEELSAATTTPPSAIAGEIDRLGKDMLVMASVVGGFYVFSAKDAAKPTQLSFTPDPGYVADIKSSEDGAFVFLGIQLAGGFTGIHVYNMLVPERPVLVGEFPMTGGCHMLAVHKGYVYCAPNDATVRIFQATETPATIVLTPVATYSPKGAPPPPVTATQESNDFTHDMTVQDDPVTGKPVMFVSFWDYGVRVVDVSSPASPKELGAWKGEGASETYGGHLHTSMAGLVDGKRVVVTIPEYAHVPSVTFLDASDYANMKVLGVWAPKKEFGSDAPSTFSTHNFQLVDGRVYLAMYHGGVWVLDAKDAAAMSHPKALGYLLPVGEAPPVTTFTTAPDVWDVVLRNGVVYASDISSGLHALHYVPDRVGDERLTSFA